MIVVRTVLQGKFGTGGQLAAAMAESTVQLAREIGLGNRWRVLTDLSGTFDNVVLEVETASLAEWEGQRAALFAHPLFAEMMGRTAGMVDGGRTDFLTVEAQG
jgi:hypothetical protein